MKLITIDFAWPWRSFHRSSLGVFHLTHFRHSSSFVTKCPANSGLVKETHVAQGIKMGIVQYALIISYALLLNKHMYFSFGYYLIVHYRNRTFIRKSSEKFRTMHSSPTFKVSTEPHLLVQSGFVQIIGKIKISWIIHGYSSLFSWLVDVFVLELSLNTIVGIFKLCSRKFEIQDHFLTSHIFGANKRSF